MPAANGKPNNKNSGVAKKKDEVLAGAELAGEEKEVVEKEESGPTETKAKTTKRGLPRGSKITAVYFPKNKKGEEIIEGIKKYAKEWDRSMNWVIVKAMEEFVARNT